MKITFYLRTNKPFDPEHVWETPFGGAEISALNLARKLCTQHDVTVVGNALQRHDGEFTIVPYRELDGLEQDMFVCVRLDPVVSIRHHRKRAEHIILWTGDAYDQSNNQMLHDPMMREGIDWIVCKSNWQRDTLLDSFWYVDESKVSVIHNGINPEYYDDLPAPDPDVFIHASVIFRGAQHLLTIWPRIKAELPNARLRIFTKASLYTGAGGQDMQYQPLYEQLSKLDGVVMHEPVTQVELAQYLGESWLMLYPNHFLESSCGVALESQAAGCPVITTSLAGLPETVGDDGILLDGLPDTRQYQDEFIKRTLELCQNISLRSDLAVSGRRKALTFSWESRAEEWNNLFDSLKS